MMVMETVEAVTAAAYNAVVVTARDQDLKTTTTTTMTMLRTNITSEQLSAAAAAAAPMINSSYDGSRPWDAGGDGRFSLNPYEPMYIKVPLIVLYSLVCLLCVVGQYSIITVSASSTINITVSTFIY